MPEFLLIEDIYRRLRKNAGFSFLKDFLTNVFNIVSNKLSYIYIRFYSDVILKFLGKLLRLHSEGFLFFNVDPSYHG